MRYPLVKILAVLSSIIIPFSAGCGIFRQSQKADNIIFTATVEDVYEKTILVSTDDAAAGFDLASVDLSGASMDFEPAVGQVIELTILPDVAESYPVQATAVSAALIDDAPSYKETDAGAIGFTARSFRADRLDDEGWQYLIAGADSSASSCGSVSEFPVFLISSSAEAGDFLAAVSEHFQTGIDYGGGTFAAYIDGLDDLFFENSVLAVVCVEADSGSITYNVDTADISGSTLSIGISCHRPEIGTMDIADWFISVALPSSAAGADCFSAVLSEG